MENEIELNGKKYVLKGIKDKKESEFEGFEFKEYEKLLKTLNKFLSFKKEYLSQSEAFAIDELGVMDPANVLLIIAKSERAKDLLRLFHHKDGEDHKNFFHKSPELDYTSFDKEIKSKYSIEYLNKIIELFSICDEVENVSFQTGSDYPLTVENDDWKAILAPRVDN